ncbi:MAG: methyltransferase family protein, partial [Pseudonocardiaceae bacterium]
MNGAVTTRQTAACEGAPVIGPPAAQSVAELGWGMWASGVVRAAAELRIADAIGEQPTTVAEIAGKIGAEPGALTRLMRALAAFGIFQPAGADSYQHTESSRALRSDADISVADILLTGSYWGALMWSMLADSVRTGECAFQRHYGKDLFTYFHEDD